MWLRALVLVVQERVSLSLAMHCDLESRLPGGALFSLALQARSRLLRHQVRVGAIKAFEVARCGLLGLMDLMQLLHGRAGADVTMASCSILRWQKAQS